MLKIPPKDYKQPYYLSNKDWYYCDIRSRREDKLTDKAPAKAVESYYKHWLDVLHYEPHHLTELIEKDLEDYKKNKNRYTFTKSEKDGTIILTAVDGKAIEVHEFWKQD